MSPQFPAFPVLVLQPQWFCSVNGGASAFTVRAKDLRKAIGAAVCRIYDELREEAASDDINMARFDAEIAALKIYTPPEWTALCLATTAIDQITAHRGAA